MRKIAAICLLALLIPYVVTLAWTGRVKGTFESKASSNRTVLLDRSGTPVRVDMEEYLMGILAVQIPAGYEEETLKAQAIIARTYLVKQMGESSEVAESALDMDYLEENQMEEMWGGNRYLEYYKKLRDAVQGTRGQVIEYEGELIDPLFHRLSAGSTRMGDELHPYLQTVEAPEDVEAESFMTITVFTPEEFASRLNSMSDSPELPENQAFESFQIIEKEQSGYVSAVQAGSKTYTGEEIRAALGLPSSAFTLEEYEGNIRCVTKGIGHGYGFDQYGADRKAEEGKTAEELLKIYYKNIVLITE